VGTYVLYQYENDFLEGMYVEFPENTLYMPCFRNEVFFIEMMEMDEVFSE